MAKYFLVTGAVLGFFGVALGAFGAHGLEATLTATGRADTFEIASRYHMVHALALLAVAWLSSRSPGRLIRWAGILLIAGVVIFSGSLYILAIFDLGVMGAVAPIGGASLLAGWGLLGAAGWRILSDDAR
jgi:uncharacterized membrane protein YgdD (TMEM256/DUF423 family)